MDEWMDCYLGWRQVEGQRGIREGGVIWEKGGFGDGRRGDVVWALEYGCFWDFIHGRRMRRRMRMSVICVLGFGTEGVFEVSYMGGGE